MKKFYGTKPLGDIEAAVKANGWGWMDDEFNRGSDYVTFQFKHGDFNEAIIFNTFNGTFIVKVAGEYITEKNAELDDTDWYAALLEFIYITDAPVVPKAGAA